MPANSDWMRVKTEDLFTSTDSEYYQGIAKFLRLENEGSFTDAVKKTSYYQGVAKFLRLEHQSSFTDALKKASPAFMSKLPSHSTGAFKFSDPYSQLGQAAKDHYDEHFAGFASRLGY